MGRNDRSCARRYRWLIGLIVLIIVAIAVAVPLVVLKPWDKDNKKDGGAISPDTPIVPSKDNSAKANAYTPALDQPFDYASGKLKMRGVNLGGWLVLEPFIAPSLFEPYIKAGVVDEYTLCKHLGPEASKTLLENHYATFVTEDTFIRIRDMGLNHIRVPLGFWAMGGLQADEPYVADVAWKYLLRAIEWARKYGIRVMVELHAAPGSQNGWNHSGRVGTINWIKGPQGPANAKRTIAYIEKLATFFNHPDYVHVNPILGLLNEPAAHTIGKEAVEEWTTQAQNAVRQATGGAGKGPWTVIHDGFVGLGAWADFLPNKDRMMLDAHQYIMFNDGLLRMNQTQQLRFACESWGSDSTTSQKAFGPTFVGEFSVAVNDCATYLNGVGSGYRWDGTFDGNPAVAPNATCAGLNTASTYTPEYKTFLRNYFNAQIDAFEQGAGWYFWNFKTENNPLWSYFDGVDGGWIPKDANNRGATFCASNGYKIDQPPPPPPEPTETATATGTLTATMTVLPTGTARPTTTAPGPRPTLEE